MIENVQSRALWLIPGLSGLINQERVEALKLPTIKYQSLYNKEAISQFLDVPHSHTREHKFEATSLICTSKKNVKRCVKRHKFKHNGRPYTKIVIVGNFIIFLKKVFMTNLSEYRPQYKSHH